MQIQSALVSLVCSVDVMDRKFDEHSMPTADRPIYIHTPEHHATSPNTKYTHVYVHRCTSFGREVTIVMYM